MDAFISGWTDDGQTDRRASDWTGGLMNGPEECSVCPSRTPRPHLSAWGGWVAPAPPLTSAPPPALICPLPPPRSRASCLPQTCRVSSRLRLGTDLPAQNVFLQAFTFFRHSHLCPHGTPSEKLAPAHSLTTRWATFSTLFSAFLSTHHLKSSGPLLRSLGDCSQENGGDVTLSLTAVSPAHGRARSTSG